MRVTRVTGSGVKGHPDFEYELAPVTLLWGANWAGKTSAVNALQLALTGRVPGLPSKPHELLRTICPEWRGGMVVTAVLSDGGKSPDTVIRREWARENGSVRLRGYDGEAVPLVLLDPAQFFGLTGPARSRFLYRCSPLPEEWASVQRLADEVCARAKAIRLEEHSADAEAAVNKAADAVRQMTTLYASMDPQEWLATVLEKVRTERNRLDEAVGRMESTGQGLALVGAAAAVNTDAEAEYEAARETLSAADEAESKAEAKADAARSEYNWATAAATAARSVDAAAVANELENQRLYLATLEKAAEKKRAVADTLEVLSKRCTEAQLAMLRAIDARDYAKKNLELKAEQESALDGLEQCPTCRRAVTKAALSKLKSGLKKERRALEDALNRAEFDVDFRQHAVSQANKEMDAVAKAKAELVANLREQEAARARVSKLEAEAEAARGRESAEKAKERAEGAVERAERDHAKAMSAAGAAKRAADKAHEAYKALLAHRADQRAKAAAAKAAAEQRTQLLVLRRLHSEVDALLGEIVAKTVGAVLAKANALCGELVPHRLAYADETICAVSPQSLSSYTHRTFSGAQGAMSYAALCVALAAGTPARVMLFDEMSRFDDRNRVRLVRHLCELVRRGELDQAVLTDVRPVQELTAADPLFRQVEVGK